MDLSRTVSEINGDFSRKSQIFPTPVYLTPPMKGFPWNWVSALGVKKLEWWGYWAEEEVWRYLQPSGYNTRTWRTDRRMDRQTDGHRVTAKTANVHVVFVASCCKDTNNLLYKLCAVHKATAIVLLPIRTRSSDKPARRIYRSVKVTKHSTIPYVRYSYYVKY